MKRNLLTFIILIFCSYLGYSQAPCATPILKSSTQGTTACTGSQPMISAYFNEGSPIPPPGFNWSMVYNGNTILLPSNGPNPWTIILPPLGVGTYTIRANPVTCTSNVGTITLTVGVPVASMPPPPPPISGPLATCVNTSSSYSVSIVPPGLTTVWSLQGWYGSNGPNVIPPSSAATPSGNPATISWVSTPQNYTLYSSYSDGNCTGSPQVIPFIANTSATSPVSISSNGTDNFCINSSFTFTATGSPGDVFTWTLSGGGTKVDNGNSTTVTWNSASPTGSPFVLSASATNLCNPTPRTASRNITVVENSLAPGTITASNTSFFAGSTQTFSIAPVAGATSYLWSISPGGPVISNGTTTSASIAFGCLNTGAYAVSVQASNGSCLGAPTTINVTSNALSAPSAISGALTPCINLAIPYSIPSVATATSYVWSVSPSSGVIISNGTTTNPTITFSIGGAYTISVYAKNAAGCNSSITQTSVNVTQTQWTTTPTFSCPSVVCVNTPATYTINSPEAGYTYVWSLSPATGGSFPSGNTGTSVSVQFNTPGTLLYVAKSSSCGTSTTQGVSPQPNIQTPSVTISQIQGPTTACLGTTLYSVPSTSSLTGVHWTLSGGGTLTTTGAFSASVTWNTPSATPYTLTATGYNACAGNTGSYSIPVTVQNSTVPIGPISGNQLPIACVFPQTYSIAPVAGAISYNWSVLPSISGFISSGGTSQMISFPSAGSYVVSVFAITGTCTSPQSQLNVSVTAPTTTVIGPSAMCANCGPATYGIYSQLPNQSSVNGGTILSPQFPDPPNSLKVLWGPVGTGTITSNNSCGTLTPYSVRIGNSAIPQPPQPIGPLSICPGTTSVYTVPPAPSGFTTSWYLLSYAPWPLPPVPVATGSSASVTWPSIVTGPYVIYASYVDTNGISGPPVGTTINGGTNTAGNPSTNTACVNTSTNITIATSGATGIGTPTGLPAGMTATWASNKITISGTPSATGTFNYSIPLTGGCGIVNATGTVTVNPSPSTSAITGIANVCANSTASYTVTNTTGSTYTWTIIGGTLISGTNTNSITVNWGAAGVGNVRVVETNASGCVGTIISKSVIINALPVTSAITGNASLCANSTASYSVTNTSGSTYAWTITGGTVTSGNGTNNITVNWSTTGVGNVKVVETNASGCVGIMVNKPVTINALPVTTTITGNASVCANSTASYTVTNTTASTYTWTITGGTLISGANTNSITVNWGAAGIGNVSVVETNASGCVGTPINITVTINPINTVVGLPNTPSICINTALPSVTFTTTGATGIGTPTGLPPGVTATWANNTITISGTPTAAGNFNYSIPLTGGCGSVNATGAITVSPTNTAMAPSLVPTLCVNTLLTNITIATTGATGIGTPTGLPPGVTATWANNTITISGTPTAAGNFTYSIPLTGGCGSVNATGAITVNPINTAATLYIAPTLCVYIAMTNITIPTTGATGIGNPIGLPPGITATWSNNAITISGTPTSAGNYTYSIPLTGGCGSVNATGAITVNPTNTAMAPSLVPTLCVNTALTNITIATTGATGIGTPTGLPPGVTATWANNTITISGTPTAAGNYTYSIPLTGGCGSVNATGAITVKSISTVSGPSSTPTLCVNTVMPNITFTTTGITGIGTTTGLPPGVTASWSNNTITISGTPSAPGTFNYSMPLTGGCGNIIANGTIIVNPTTSISTQPMISQTVCLNGTVSPLAVTVSGTVAYQWYSNTINSNSGGTLISGAIASSYTPSSASIGTKYYYVVATGACGTVTSAVSTVKVNSSKVLISASNGFDLCSISSTTLTATALSGATSYSWSSSYGDYSGTSQTLTVYDPETYTVTVNIPGCGLRSASATTTYNCSPPPPPDPCLQQASQSGFTTQNVAPAPCPAPQIAVDVENNEPFSYYPNPVAGHVTIVLTKTAVEDSPVTWYDMSGHQVRTDVIEKGKKEKTFKLDEIVNGMYLVQVKDSDRIRFAKIVVMK